MDLGKANVRVEGDTIFLSTKRCAAFFGVTSKTLLEWRRAGCPQADRGWWVPEEVYRWRVGLESGASEGESNWQGVKLRAEAEYRAAKAAQEEIHLEVLRGKFIPSDQVKEAWADRLTACRVNMFSWIHTLPPFLEGLARVELERVLEEEVRALWEAYSQDGPFTPTVAGKDCGERT